MRSRIIAVVVTLCLTPFMAQEAPASAQEGAAVGQGTPAAAVRAIPGFDLKPDASGNVPQDQIRELLRRVAEKDLENNKRLRDYTYVQREETRQLDGHGNVKKVESQTSEVLQIYGETVERVIAKNDKPLSERDAKKEDEKIQKIIDKRKNESEEDRRKRLAKEEKQREDDRQFVREVADAFNYRLVGTEVLDGREAWVLEAEPRPGFQPQRKEARMLTKFKGRIWIDKAELQWVKIDMTAIDTLSYGVILARVHKGTRVMVEQARINQEVWLPRHIAVHVDARVALFKNFDADIDVAYRDYKKFRSETKVTVVGETK